MQMIGSGGVDSQQVPLTAASPSMLRGFAAGVSSVYVASKILQR
jgi:hypothetical protein